MDIRYNEAGLIPAIAQDADTGRVLMLAWMNAQSLEQTLRTGYATYWSRSRQELWQKGATSGNLQRVRQVLLDCDGDTLLLKVDQTGNACHTGEKTCFGRSLPGEGLLNAKGGAEVLAEVMDVVLDRRVHPKEGSYTNYLFDKGVDKICKKIGEEAAEVIIAAKNDSKDELRYEAADLLYHLTVLMADRGLTWGDLFAELAERR